MSVSWQQNALIYVAGQAIWKRLTGLFCLRSGGAAGLRIMAIAMSAAPPALSGFALPGLRVGHFTDSRRPTGCTVVLVDDPAGAVAGVDVRGAAPGTRETDLLSPLNTVERAHAVLLAGGSAFGLQAADGVMGWLEAQGVGVPVEIGRAHV